MTLPVRQPADGPIQVSRVRDGYLGARLGESYIEISDYQAARLVLLLCVMNEWDAPKKLRGLVL